MTDQVFEHYVGQTLLIRGSYGNGFDLETYKGNELIIVAGGTGVSPVRGVIDHFARNHHQVTKLHVITGFKNTDAILFKADLARWKETCNLIVTLDVGELTADLHVGLVTQYIPELPLENPATAKAIVVGPPPMMKFSALALLKAGIAEDHIWVSQERKMCCGIGKCGHCKINDTYICLDDPVFNYTVGKTLID